MLKEGLRGEEYITSCRKTEEAYPGTFLRTVPTLNIFRDAIHNPGWIHSLVRLSLYCSGKINVNVSHRQFITSNWLIVLARMHLDHIRTSAYFVVLTAKTDHTGLRRERICDTAPILLKNPFIDLFRANSFSPLY
jgi:hypothetical protein